MINKSPSESEEDKIERQQTVIAKVRAAGAEEPLIPFDVSVS